MVIRLPMYLLALLVAALGVPDSAATAQPTPERLSVEARAGILSAVLLARLEILADSSPIGGCGIFEALDQRRDYLSLLDSLVRRSVYVASPAPCSPDPIEADSSLTTAEKRRLMLARWPRGGANIRSIERDGDGAIVTLTVSRASYGYSELHRVGPVRARGRALPWRVGEINVRTIIVY